METDMYWSFLVKSLYADFLHGHTRFLRKYLWKLKIPLKTKLFLWILHRKVLLTKDNLARRRWTGWKKCVFCHAEESVEHLVISFPFARHICRLIHFTFSISSPTGITNMFGNWLNGIDKKTRTRIRVGVSAFLCAIWNCRNDNVLNKSGAVHYLQVINRAVYWIHMWSSLLPSHQRGHMDIGCARLMAVVRAIFSWGGWLHYKRLNA